MNNDTFWTHVENAADKIGVREGTFRTWKSRKCVPENMVVDLHLALRGTPHELSLELLKAHTIKKQ